MLAISQLSLPKICKGNSLAGPTCSHQRIPCPRIQQWPFRIVHPRSRASSAFSTHSCNGCTLVLRAKWPWRDLRLFAGAS